MVKEQIDTSTPSENQSVEEKSCKKSSPFLTSTIGSDEKNATPSKKKESPFLSTEVKESEDEKKEEEASSTKIQHNQIDNLVKNTSIFNTVGKLYFKSPKTNKLETRGEGKFIILKDKSELYRLMMIRDQVMLKGCDHYILASCPLTKATQVKNSWIWTAFFDESDAEKKEEKTIYFATFRDEESSNLFETKYNEAKEHNGTILEAKKKEKASN